MRAYQRWTTYDDGTARRSDSWPDLTPLHFTVLEVDLERDWSFNRSGRGVDGFARLQRVERNWVPEERVDSLDGDLGRAATHYYVDFRDRIRSDALDSGQREPPRYAVFVDREVDYFVVGER
jgi:hypothetical protein